MKARIQFTPQAAEDLDAIWWAIAEDSRDAADRNSCHLSPAGETSPHGNEAAGHHAVTRPLLDRREIP